jgi:copper chaperone CopZ
VKAKFIIDGMHCSNCVLALESIEDELPGIQDIIASYQKQQLVVQFDTGAVDVEKIIQAITKKGYRVKSYSIEN